MRPFFLTILVLLALAPFIPAVRAQPDFPYHSEESHAFTINLRTALDPVSQYFLQEMGRGNNTGLDKTDYSIVFNTDIYQAQKSDTLIELKILIDIGKITGDTRYKTFDVSHFLKPSEVKAVLTFKGLKRNGRDTLVLNKQPIAEPLTLFIPCHQSELDYHEPHYVDIKTLQPIYQVSDMDKLQQYLSVIDDYYVSGAIMDTVKRLLNQCENGSTLKLTNKVLNLLECENILYHLNEKHFVERLMLPQHDPLFFITTFQGLMYRYKHLRSSDLNTPGLLSKRAYPLNWATLAKCYTNRFMKYIELSYLVNFYEVTSYHELAKVIYSQSRIASLRSFLRVQSDQCNVNSEQLFHAVVLQWIDQARQQVDKELYYDAFIPIANAAHLITLNHARSNEPALDKVRSIAYHGMYDSYLNLAYRFFDIGDLAKCDNYLAKAYELILEKPSYVLIDSLFYQIVNNIAKTYIHQALLFPDSLHYNKLTYLQKAKESIYKYFPAYSFLDSITLLQLHINEQRYRVILDKWESSIAEGDLSLADAYASQAIDFATANLNDPLYQEQAFGVIRKIHGYTYQTLLYETDRLINLGDIPMAVVKLQEADRLAVAYGIPMSPTYITLLQTIFKPVFMEKISRGRMHVWLNDLDKADEIFLECQDMAERNHLTSDAEVLNALRNFKDLIRQK